MVANSLGAAFVSSCRQHAAKSALMHKKVGAYRSITYADLGEQVLSLAAALLHQGVKPGDHVGLISDNRPEWAVVDFAVLCIGAVVVPVFPSLSASQVQYIIKDSCTTLIFAENSNQTSKVESLLQDGTIEAVWVFEGYDFKSDRVHDFSDLLAQSKDLSAIEKLKVEEIAQTIEPHHLATLIYTSGTTGQPKGVMLTHGNILSNMASILQVLDIGPSDTMLSILPLSHVFERVCGHFLPLTRGATLAYVESLSTAAADLLSVKPTVMIAVPRFYEKLRTHILESAEKSPTPKRRLFSWAMETGRRFHAKRPSPETDSWLAFQHRLAQRLVFSKLKKHVGGRIRFFVSGGAALPVDVAEFFQAAGLTLLEGYGLTETSPVLCVNRPDRNCIGTVGEPLPGVEIKIAPDGEILARGENVTRGYHNLPEETSSAVEGDGFFHTGDIGHFDEDGCLVITDRKKNLIVTSGGKNVAPTAIENLLKTSPYIGEAMVIGEGRHFLSALIVPDYEQLRFHSQQWGIAPDDESSPSRDPRILRLIQSEIDRLCCDLANYERIKKFTLLPRDFSITQNELTPTLKVRRRVVTERFFELIEKMYETTPSA